ncbi:MAG: lmo0937 family membrane protein [Acidobacteriaceae bacterium]|nr:lmo0937 family membrane protein [Acidobacteriaceae bacterium]
MLFFILLIVWLVAWAAMHVAGGFVHLLIVIAVISLIIHFVRGRTA